MTAIEIIQSLNSLFNSIFKFYNLQLSMKSKTTLAIAYMQGATGKLIISLKGDITFVEMSKVC